MMFTASNWFLAGGNGDCPQGLRGAPASANERPCSGKGVPVGLAGSCLCFVGYDGAGCGDCVDGCVADAA